MPPPARALVPRRTTLRAALALTGATAVAASGCTGGEQPPDPPEPSPDALLAAAALADERRLVARLAATASRHADLADLLAGTRDVHERHVRLLLEAIPARTVVVRPEGGAAATTPGAPEPDRDPAATPPPPVPPRPAAALAGLAGAEGELAAAHAGRAVSAESGPFARVLGSLAAAAAQQAAVLDGTVR